jgi:protein-disulfide isomerase
MRRISFDATVNTVLAVASIVMALSYAKASFTSRSIRAPVSVERLNNWEVVLAYGHSRQSAQGSVKLVEFTDLQCPVCRSYHQTVQEARAARPEVVHVYVPFPLPIHRFALPAAKAAECAVGVGRLEPFVEALYAKQDSLGVRSWGSYALDAGIEDTSVIAACATSPERVARIDTALAIGERLGVRGTPTIVVGGWRFSTPPTLPVLLAAIDSVAAGRRPRPTS